MSTLLKNVGHPLLVVGLGGLALLGCANDGLKGSPGVPFAGTASFEQLDAKSCSAHPLALQVLGSGGPISDDDRASASYVIWMNGHSRVLIDAGGGSSLRFGQSGASVDALKVIGISHLHVDHVGDLPALMKSAYFGQRTNALPIVGPDGNARFPSLGEYLSTQFGEGGGYRYLSGYLESGSGRFSFEPEVVDWRRFRPQTVYRDGEVELTAIGVRHGQIPSLGYLATVSLGESVYRIAFGGDQNANNPEFAELIRGADLLVLHHPIPEHAKQAYGLHAPPSAIGALARSAEVGRLVLSHHMQRSLRELPDALLAIKANQTAEVSVAKDLDCYPLIR